MFSAIVGALVVHLAGVQDSSKVEDEELLVTDQRLRQRQQQQQQQQRQQQQYIQGQGLISDKPLPTNSSSSSRASTTTTTTAAKTTTKTTITTNTLTFSHTLPVTSTLRTPLLIPFTRNFPILQQCLQSYLSLGWPASQIFILDNTGLSHENAADLLEASDPFHLPHGYLRDSLGISVLSGETLLSFAQVMNWIVAWADSKGWSWVYWGHMDCIVVPSVDTDITGEGIEKGEQQDVDVGKGYKEGILRVLETTIDIAPTTQWGVKFFSYDRLSLVNPAAILASGGWDTLIPYYFSDCDMYSRLRMHGYSVDEVVGVVDVFDVGDLLPQEGMQAVEEGRYQDVYEELVEMQERKNAKVGGLGRNDWQGREVGEGGSGQRQKQKHDREGLRRDKYAFEMVLRWWMDLGERVYMAKWGLDGWREEEGGEGVGAEENEVINKCDLVALGKGLDDIWKDGKARFRTYLGTGGW